MWGEENKRKHKSKEIVEWEVNEGKEEGKEKTCSGRQITV